MMKLTSSRQAGFKAVMAQLQVRGEMDIARVEGAVNDIINDVRMRGDKALVSLAARFDKARLTAARLRVSPSDIRRARRSVGTADLRLLEKAAERIKDFHRRQLRLSWWISQPDGSLLGQNITPMERVGLYVPGGKAVYPSTVLMNAVPAQVAGVERIIICTPATGGEVNPMVLAAADVLGLDEIYRVGGAQAIAAMAYGTARIPAVDKIVGPGNIYVAAAKKAVFGKVSIDSIAGPSEIFIIADDEADPAALAADLLSQAEHDEMATAVLITVSVSLARRVQAALKGFMARLPRRRIAETSLSARGHIILARDLDEAFDLATRLAPEHLEIMTRDPLQWLPRVRFAGSAFFGPYTPEVLGDYLGGPNHVLPTGGAARFSSSLGVDDFMVRGNIMAFTAAGFAALGEDVVRFAEMEGLSAHALSADIRLKAKPKSRIKE